MMPPTYADLEQALEIYHDELAFEREAHAETRSAMADARGERDAYMASYKAACDERDQARALLHEWNEVYRRE